MDFPFNEYKLIRGVLGVLFPLHGNFYKKEMNGVSLKSIVRIKFPKDKYNSVEFDPVAILALVKIVKCQVINIRGI